MLEKNRALGPVLSLLLQDVGGFFKTGVWLQLIFHPKSKVAIILITDIYMSSLDPLLFIVPIQLWVLPGKSPALSMYVFILNSRCQTSRHSSSSTLNCLCLFFWLSCCLIFFIHLMTLLSLQLMQNGSPMPQLGCSILKSFYFFYTAKQCWANTVYCLDKHVRHITAKLYLYKKVKFQSWGNVQFCQLFRCQKEHVMFVSVCDNELAWENWCAPGKWLKTR